MRVSMPARVHETLLLNTSLLIAATREEDLPLRGLMNCSQTIFQTFRLENFGKLCPIMLVVLALGTPIAGRAQSCPIESAAIENAKPNKLYLYFPTSDDAAFPATTCTIGTSTCFPGTDPVRPLKAFDIANLTDYTGTSSDLEDEITKVVIDDYCEFNVKVFETTSVPPTTFPRRSTIGIGTDANGSCSSSFTWGLAQEVDTGDALTVDFARVWAGTYEVSAGAACSKVLSGTNSTLQRWGFSIGGTAAHEAGHTYGLAHTDDKGTTGLDQCTGTDHTKPGEDALFRHLMPAGCNITDEQRAGFRRHFSDATYSILASNVGLSVETIHNWDFTNPNSAAASQLEFEVLSTSVTLTPSWTYLGNLSPWTAPSVTSIGTTAFKGTTYNRYRITFSNGQAWANGSPGNVPGGAQFHVGVAFSEADFGVPDSVIVVKVSLLDAGSTPLTLQPRMIAYNTGALDASDGSYRVTFFNADNPSRALILKDLTVTQLPMLASIDSMVRGSGPETRYRERISPWRSTRPLCDRTQTNVAAADGCEIRLTDQQQAVTVAKLAQGRNVVQVHDGKCVEPGVNGSGDSNRDPDVNACPSSGVNIDLFPATSLYLTATVIDPGARHWDPVNKTFVTGPLESHLFYQIAGRHPDLNRNGIDDFIDILQGKSKDKNGDGVPDEAQQCQKQSSELDICEQREGDLRREWADVERHEIVLSTCEKTCQGKPNEEMCATRCEEEREKIEGREHELEERAVHQGHECREDLVRFKHCEKQAQ
jgi:hypothetical protein